MNVQHRGHLDRDAGLTRMTTALAGVSTDAGIPPSGGETLGGCSIVVYSHSCSKPRKAGSLRTLTSETTDSVFRMVAGWIDLNGHVQQWTGNDVRSCLNTSSSLQVVSPWEGKRRSMPASSELRSCLRAAVSVRRSRQKKDQLVLSRLLQEQHHLAAYGQRGFHV